MNKLTIFIIIIIIVVLVCGTENYIFNRKIKLTIECPKTYVIIKDVGIVYNTKYRKTITDKEWESILPPGLKQGFAVVPKVLLATRINKPVKTLVSNLTGINQETPVTDLFNTSIPFINDIYNIINVTPSKYKVIAYKSNLNVATNNEYMFFR